MNKDPIIDSHHQSRRYVLLTGATGLVGRYLMRDLFLKGCHLAVVVRPSKRMNVQQRIECILQAWESELGRRLPRPIIFEGDVCEPNLGLAAEEILWVRKHCDRMIHSAAVLQFNGASRDEDPWRTNLGGTKNVLALSKLAEISEFHYVSTAYVCGKRDDLVLENDNDCNQEFRNDYERSKFEAEQLVTASTHFSSTTIYRPAVIVGDSKTGYTSTYHGLFLYLRLLHTLVPQQKRNEKGIIETPIRLPMDGDEPRNLIPVDWVSDVISHVFCNPAAHGRTYHLSPDKCTTAREVIEYCYEYFNSCGVEFCGSDAERAGDNEFAAKYFENVSVYEQYETSDPQFDKQNVKDFAGQFKCPPINKEMTLRFLEFGKSNRWGKQRDKIPTVERWFDSQLAHVVKTATNVLDKLNSNSLGTCQKFGLDIHGPGGGQWQLTASADGEFEVALGLPEDGSPVITMDDLQVGKLLAANSADSFASGTPCPTSLWNDRIESVLTTRAQ